MEKRRTFFSLVLVASTWLLSGYTGCGPMPNTDCDPGAKASETCACEVEITRTCNDSGQWEDWSDDCVTLCDTCTTGDQETRSCNECGTKTRTCVDGQWESWSACREPLNCDSPECTPGNSEIEDCSGECQISKRVCGATGFWSEWSSCYHNPDCSTVVCTPGDAQTEDCGTCGTSTRTCGSDGQWSSWGQCEEPRTCPQCTAGASETQSCGGCGSQTRTCGADLQWSAWSTCDAPSPCPVCTPDETQSQVCNQCGNQSRTCDADGQWTVWTTCDAPDPCPQCAATQVETRSCDTCGQQNRSCDANLQWTDWSTCEEPVEGCPRPCQDMRTVWQSDNSQIVAGLALVGDSIAATTVDSWGMATSYLRVLSLDDGSQAWSDSYGSWQNDTSCFAINSPVVDTSNQAVFLSYSTWQSQMGDDGPAFYLKSYDFSGQSHWNITSFHYYSSDAYGYGFYNDTIPTLVNDSVYLNLANRAGMSEVLPQTKGFAKTDGTTLWSQDAWNGGALSADGNGNIFIYSGGMLFSFAPATGAQALHFVEPNRNTSPRESWGPAIDRSGFLYVGQSFWTVGNTVPEAVHKIDPNSSASPSEGQSVWTATFPSGTRVTGSPILGTSSVFVPTSKGLYALDKDSGAVLWHFDTGEHVARQPLAGDDGKVYFSRWGEQLQMVGLKADGTEDFSCTLLEDASTATEAGNYGLSHTGVVEPVLTSAGELIMGAGTKIVAIPVTSHDLANSGWPKTRADNQNTGRVR